MANASRWTPQCLCVGIPELVVLLLAAVLLVLTGCGTASDPVSGLWQAEVLSENGPNVAFQLEVRKDGDQWKGALVNGPDREEATSGTFDGKTLLLKFNFYDAELRADLTDGKLTGEFARQRGKTRLVRKLVATRDLPQYAASSAGTPLTGDWILEVGEGDSQRIWSASLKQEGEKLTGTVIPISGDWGTISGHVRNGEIYLSRFDGIRALLLTAKVAEDGTLQGSIGPDRKVVGRRLEQAVSQGAKPQDPGTYTSMKNPDEPFRFQGVDLDGKPVSSTDPRFQGKVVVITITGTWCPNCHDEAPVLVDLYAKYKSQGLEVVALAYEYTGDQARDLEQLKIYRQRHGIEFPLLLAGTTEPGEIARTLPQLENFGAYPTTIYVGRDGKVDYIHAGFESKATGERHQKLVEEMEHRIQAMLQEGKS
jgi:thiol-disulfide isomerase/thioredoxin